jgi:hypothetical protein
MMKRAGFAALMVVCPLLALPGLAGAATATTVTIKAQEGGFFGYVKSKKGACEAGRKVSLYRQTGKKRNGRSDKRIGTDTAQPNGPDSMWSINTDKSGKFYAYVKATSKCAAAYSATIRAQTATVR